jgi:hypothetical protein
VKAAVVTGATFLAYLTSVPHLSIQEDFPVDPSNPYSESFSIENEGFLPATDLSADCRINMSNAPNRKMNSNMVVDHVAAKVPYKRRISLPCDRFMSYPNMILDQPGVLIINVTYFVAGTPLTRMQSFKFETTQQADGTYRWLYR